MGRDLKLEFRSKQIDCVWIAGAKSISRNVVLRIRNEYESQSQVGCNGLHVSGTLYKFHVMLAHDPPNEGSRCKQAASLKTLKVQNVLE